MLHIGNMLKMNSFYDIPVRYSLMLDSNEIAINSLLEKEITIKYLHEIYCIRCGRKTSKSFAQGYCFPCFRSAPETEDCVIRPELCKAHEGISRDIDFARKHCLIDHYVYLAYTSNIKVGVTRITQIPTRWIDQGAIRAIKIAKTPNRYLAGRIEVLLKDHFRDKTNWRSMLHDININISTDLKIEKDKAIKLLPEEFRNYALPENEITEIQYPVQCIPSKIISIDLDKTDVITDVLCGIKGQYLIFKSGKVLNVRKYNGYRIELKC